MSPRKKSTKESKSTRSPNFSNFEKELLTDLVVLQKDTLKNNRTDGVSVQKKKEGWIQLAKNFNSNSGVNKRSAEALKIAFENLERRTKKNVSSEKVRMYKTGGGSSPCRITKVEEKVVALLGPKIIPMPNRFDSDSGYNHGISHANETGNSVILFTENDLLDVGTGNVDGGSLELTTRSNMELPVEDQPSASQPGSSKTRRNNFLNRRRPNAKAAEKEKRLTSTVEVVNLAKSKRAYYDRLLQMAEIEHVEKIKMLRSKSRHFESKTQFKSKSVIPILNSFQY